MCSLEKSKKENSLGQAYCLGTTGVGARDIEEEGANTKEIFCTTRDRAEYATSCTSY